MVAYISETGNGDWEELPGVTYIPGLEQHGFHCREFVSTEPEKFEEIWNRYAEKTSCHAWFMYEEREGLRKNEDGRLVRQDFPIVKFSARLWPTRITRYASNQVDELNEKISHISDVYFYSIEEDNNIAEE